MQEHSSSIDGRLIFPVGLKLCPPSAIHCAYNFLTLSLNGLLTETSKGCNTDVRPPGITAKSVFISERSFVSSTKWPWKLSQTRTDRFRSNAPGRLFQTVRMNYAKAWSTRVNTVFKYLHLYTYFQLDSRCQMTKFTLCVLKEECVLAPVSGEVRSRHNQKVGRCQYDCNFEDNSCNNECPHKTPGPKFLFYAVPDLHRSLQTGCYIQEASSHLLEMKYAVLQLWIICKQFPVWKTIFQLSAIFETTSLRIKLKRYCTHAHYDCITPI